MMTPPAVPSTAALERHPHAANRERSNLKESKTSAREMAQAKARIRPICAEFARKRHMIHLVLEVVKVLQVENPNIQTRDPKRFFLNPIL